MKIPVCQGPSRRNILSFTGFPVQTKSSDEGGGLGALTTLARAVEQENHREELSTKLVEETKTLDVLKAEVGTRLGEE